MDSQVPSTSGISVSNGSSEDPRINTRLYVGLLPVNYCVQDFLNLCRPYGVVRSVKISFNSRNTKAYGFVTFARPQDAQSCQNALHNTLLAGQVIKVKHATKSGTRTWRAVFSIPSSLPLPAAILYAEARHVSTQI